MRDVVRLSFVALSIGLVGCGGGGGGGGSVPTVQPSAQGAATVTALTVDLSASLQGNDGSAVANQVMALGMSGPQQIAMMPAGPAAVIRSAASVPGPNGGSVDCTATGCLYDQYASSTGATFVMDGSILTSLAGELAAVTVDLDITMDTGGVAQAWVLSGGLDVSPALLDGTLTNNGTGHLTAQGQNVSYKYYEELTYNAVTLTGGQPTGGSVFAKWSMTVQGQTYGAQATMTF